MPPQRRSPATGRTGAEHLRAVGQALLVTFLWSTSWVLIKIGLTDLDLEPLGFAALRYVLAALVLAPLALSAARAAWREPARRPGWRLLALVALYGVLWIAIGQGAQFGALALLPATAVNLVLSSIPIVVAAGALARREEAPSVVQLGGIVLLVAGAVLYFGPVELDATAGLGIGVALVCVVASAASSLLGRELARDGMERLGGAIPLTAASMAVGALFLLPVAVAVEGVPALDVRGWAIVAWLAVVNSAFAVTLWNHTLRTLTAVESSVVNNTMVVQIAVLAVIFLGERLTVGQVLGLGAAALGATVVQVAPRLFTRRDGERAPASPATELEQPIP